ncbi:MAG: FecR domain-containing protein, partial [Deltaproteobacteria bacterium]|nr:FecR domain-containing protein [Deltaproteobacteria bacterium]MBW2530821.1 FecR domain-containing protein [Deltaproteobacteria bacterium]
MSQDDSHHWTARAMRQLVDLVRSEPTPDVDWSRVEAALQSRIRHDATLRRTGEPRWQRHGLVAVGVFAAAAAVLALMVTSPAASPLPERQADSVVLSSGSEARTFDLGDGARCTLGPDSRAALRCAPGHDAPSCGASTEQALHVGRGGLAHEALAVATPFVLVLERGSVSADVRPLPAHAPLVEALVVEAAGVRVAVHGTLFRVERGEREVTVEVTRGSVTVGPAGHRGLTTGHLLVGPARAAFSVDGGRVARLLPLPGPPPADRAPPRAIAAAGPSGSPLGQVPTGPEQDDAE